MVGDHFVNSSSCNVISGCVNTACTQRVRCLCSPDLLMATTFLMNEVPLSVSHFLYFDLLPLGFKEQELSRKVRISVICVLRRGESKVHMCACAHAFTCANMCAHVYSFGAHARTHVYVCVRTCEPVFICACCTFLGLSCALQMCLKALRLLSRYNSNKNS